MRAKTRAASAALLVLSLASAAFSVAPADRRAGDEARRFGLDEAPPPAGPSLGLTYRGRAAIQDFNASHRGRFNLRYGAQGLGTPERRIGQLAAKEAAELFLREHGASLGLNPAQLRLESARSAEGIHHLLFAQVVEGVPVEFSRVKVHLKESGEIVALQSSYRPALARPVPGISEAAAASAAGADLGAAAPRAGTLVFFPMPDGAVLLAWKFRTRGGWIYYVDARDGRILFRYSELVRQACQTSGTITGQVYDVDPVTTPGPVNRAIKNQKVYIKDGDTYVYTDANGYYCSAVAGKIVTGLQGRYATVSNYVGPSMHFDNGSGEWRVYGTTVASTSPYPNDSTLTVQVSIADSQVGATPVKIAPHFTSFHVGDAAIDAGEFIISDNDQLAILDAQDNVVATYVGSRPAFNGAAVPGRTYKLRLSSNESGSYGGYNVNISSYLVLPAGALPGTPNNVTGTFTWGTGQAHLGKRDELNIFYQLNMMHDYFRDGPDAGGNANIDWPVPVMARVGPNVANAFYDPAHRNLSFGDASDRFALDASVVRHEYVHFVIDQIYPIINFGQNGAISEAMADYFAASSMDDSRIGRYAALAFGTEGALRNLQCTNPPDNSNPCKVFPTDWQGTVHDDSPMLSQGLWELREALRASPLGSADGKACADGLVFQSLFYFPDSFQEFLEAMVTVDFEGQVAACGGARRHNATIIEKFGRHGILLGTADAGDSYEPNDGIQSATDISTATRISARIYPAGDIDYYAFGAGAGKIRMTLGLPQDETSPTEYRAFSLNLVDRHFKVIRTANPAPSNPTLAGYCPEPGGSPPYVHCLTYSKEVVIDYDNPSPGQFFLMVSAPPGDSSNISRNHYATPYFLVPEFNQGAVDSGIVSAVYDSDVLSFAVTVATHVRLQNFTFDHARLRDHSLNVLPGTATDGASPYMTFVSSSNALGRVSGTLRLAAGFHSRFPSVGTVHLEVFGRNPLGNVQTLGFSRPLNLTGNRTALTAWNNVFNPLKGEKTTIKFETMEPGSVRLRLHTLSGRVVKTLLDGYQPAGQGSVDWDGRNLGAEVVASGIYLLHMEGPGISAVKKVIVVK